MRETFTQESSLIVQEARLYKRSYLVVLAQHFESKDEAEATAERLSKKLDADDGGCVVMETTYDISPVRQ